MDIPSQRPVTPSFGVSFDVRLNNRSSKQSRRRDDLRWLRSRNIVIVIMNEWLFGTVNVNVIYVP